MGRIYQFRVLQEYGKKVQKVKQAKIISLLEEEDRALLLKDGDRDIRGICAGITTVWLRSMMNLDRLGDLKSIVGSLDSYHLYRSPSTNSALAHFKREDVINIQHKWNKNAKSGGSSGPLQATTSIFESKFDFSLKNVKVYHPIVDEFNKEEKRGVVKLINNWREIAVLNTNESKVKIKSSDGVDFIDSIAYAICDNELNEDVKKGTGMMLHVAPGHALGLYRTKRRGTLCFFDANIGAYVIERPWEIKEKDSAKFFQFFQLYENILRDVNKWQLQLLAVYPVADLRSGSG